MPARGDRRRAAAGCTHDPWPCCGKAPGAYGRPKNEICQDCGKLIADGKAANAAATAARSGGDLGVFVWTEKHYAWPKFYGSDADLPTDVHERLSRAFFDLVNLVTVPAPAGTPQHSPDPVDHPSWKGQTKDWPFMLTGRADQFEWRTLRLANPAVRDGLDQLHQAIKAALGVTYHNGRNSGASILHRLATGDLALTDFDEALLPADERVAREKARRGY